MGAGVVDFAGGGHIQSDLFLNRERCANQCWLAVGGIQKHPHNPPREFATRATLLFYSALLLKEGSRKSPRRLYIHGSVLKR
jgi:hypothetical protein